MLVELHCHSRFSDGLPAVEQIMLRAARGLGAIAITDHDTLAGYRAARKLKLDILLIPALEITSTDGHILALGVNSIVQPRMTAAETIDAIHGQGGIAIAAHPFGGMTRPSITNEDALRKMDAIEVLNGGTFMRQNNLAYQLAKKLRMPMTSGSDAHLLKNVGRFSCEVKADSVDGILNAIKRGKVVLPERKTNSMELIIDKARKSLHIG